mmetsp:Transcript_4547/g.11407  ORF Transcript_4547/g.11407 Transcript_4547/m.11407 type:complete len:335 (+) Transcript_4547:122-1126(+)
MKIQKWVCAFAVAPVGLAESKAATSILQTFKSLDIRYFVAGGTCAAISHGITTPIDVVKTKIQSNSKKYNKGLASTAITLVKEDGPGVLLGGIGPTVVGYGIEGAMKFGVYEIMKPVFSELFQTSDGSNKALAFIMASVVAGAVAALLLCPMESARIKMVTDNKYKNTSTMSALGMIIRDDGIGSIFSSVWAMLAKQVPYTFGKQVSFDVFASMLYLLYNDFQDKVGALNKFQIKWGVSVLAAFLASLIACIFSQPGDMILTETFRPSEKGAARNPGSQRFSNVIRKLYAEGGIPRFFTGTGARIVHVSAIITSQLVIYDIVKQMLGLPATGSH